MADQQTRVGTLTGGGGQASGLTDHQSTAQFTPLLSFHLERLYRSLVSSGIQDIYDGPPLATYDQFLSWFHSSASTALAPPVNHDMSFPLCNYYISTSHNTYLSGNQLYGAASTESYRNVLLRGCRSLEIDVWNGLDEEASISGSEREELQQQDKKPDHLHKERALSKLKSFRGKLSHEIHATKEHGDAYSHGFNPAGSQPHGGDLDDLSRQMSATEIAEKRAKLTSEPRVYHGHTLTKDVPFRDVCEAIKESAFQASTLPIIVSLEVHCSLDQQKVMVEIMEETWKGYLVDMTDRSYDSIAQLPSPDSLRNKILIKVKWTSSTNIGETNNPLEIARTITRDPETRNGPYDTEAQHAQKKKASKILDALSRLGIYTRGYSFKSFSQPEANIPTHVFSIEENKIVHLHEDPQDGPAMFKHNRNFLVRIYPFGLRFDSSNIDPTFSWRQGAQMVALNWQSLDKGMMLNEGMFAGEEGYVLKPEGFRSLNISNQPEPIRKRLDLGIRLIAAQNLPLPNGKLPSHAAHIKPFVKLILHVDTHGPPGLGKRDRSKTTASLNSRYENADAGDDEEEEKDEDERKLKRQSKTGKTATTAFDGAEMLWADIPDVVEQLSFLRIKVEDDRTMAKDELLAWACIRLDRLKTGWRLLHLLDVNGSPSEGVLLVHIDKKIH